MDKQNGYEKIGPTAWSVARFRAQADIKYAKEILDELDATVQISNDSECEYVKMCKESKLAPKIEARYKLLDQLISQNQTGQILELAAGLSPRGLQMTQDNPDLKYVEVDLPYMAECKRELLKGLLDKGLAELHDNLHIEDGDALDGESLLAATKYFQKGPIIVTHEGLLRYMNFEQKAMIARNIRELLKEFGGTWITCDITLPKVVRHHEEGTINRELVKAMSGIDIEKNMFNDVDEAMKFFEDLGFSVEKHSFLEVKDELVSPVKLGMTDQELYELIGHAFVFVMRLC